MLSRLKLTQEKLEPVRSGWYCEYVHLYLQYCTIAVHVYSYCVLHEHKYSLDVKMHFV